MCKKSKHTTCPSCKGYKSLRIKHDNFTFKKSFNVQGYCFKCGISREVKLSKVYIERQTWKTAI
jgi:hypothetical protein